MNTMLDEKTVASKLTISVATLRKRRLQGRPPRWIKLGTSVRYRAEDVEAWLESCPGGGDVPVNTERAS
jgi:predicted DNA-binding transcriptional regulator AlpA